MATATSKDQSLRDELDILALVETVHRAHHNKDAAAIVAPYAQDAVICDLADSRSQTQYPGVDRDSR